MGQRSQTFIRINNPMKQKEYVDMLNDEEVIIGHKVFGKGKTTILPFHHQWLYGMTFVGIAHRILSEARKNYTNRFHPLSSNFNKANYCSDYVEEDKRTYISNTKIQQTINLVKHIIGFQDNKDIADITSRYGIERFTYLGDYHLKPNGTKYRGSVPMSESCALGDNNDGILIIDAINHKYAFINIFTFDYGDEDLDDIYLLKPMQPYSAKEYVRAYYPGNTEAVVFIKDLMKDFDVLTIEELSKIFPKNFKK
jgi:hypothetical protein